MLLIMLCIPMLLFAAAENEPNVVKINPHELSLRARSLRIICQHEISPPSDLNAAFRCLMLRVIHENLDSYVEQRMHSITADFIQDVQNNYHQRHHWPAACEVFAKLFYSNFTGD